MPSLKIPLEVGAVVECRVRAMPISDAEYDRALATILGADGLYLADEVRDVAAVLASHLIERFEAAYAHTPSRRYVVTPISAQDLLEKHALAEAAMLDLADEEMKRCPT